MSTRLSEQYRFTGVMSVRGWGSTSRPKSSEVNGFIKLQDGRVSVTAPQDLKDCRMQGQMPEHEWIELDPTGTSAGEYVEAMITDLLEVQRLNQLDYPRPAS